MPKLCECYGYWKMYAMFNFISYVLIFVSIEVLSCLARLRIIDRGVRPLSHDSVGLFLYIDVENESYLQQYSLSSKRERCCLRVDVDQMDCSSPELIGGDWFIQPKEKKSLTLVYPTLFQHDKVGVCSLELLSTCVLTSTITKRNVDIQFDTRIFGDVPKNLFKNYISLEKAHRCISPDDDTLNNCEPVDCNIKYGGNRSFFDHRVRRCVPTVPCLRTLSKKSPDVVYVPSGNVCRNLEQPLPPEELYHLSVGSNTVLPLRRRKKSNDADFVCNCTTISQFFRYGIDVMLGKYGDSHECINQEKFALLAVCALIFTACWQLALCVGAMVLVLKLREMWQKREIQQKASTVLYFFTNLKKKANKRSEGTADDEDEDGEEKNILLNELMSVAHEDDLRRSASDLCERMSREISTSRRYRNKDFGSQVCLFEARRKEGSQTSKEQLPSKPNLT